MRLFTIALTVCAAVFFHSSAIAEEISLAGEFGEPRVIIPAPEDEAHRHLSWPKVQRTPDGTLVAAYLAGNYHGSHGGNCPAISISTDEGQTFSPPNILKRYRRGLEYTSAGNVALGLAEDGALVLLSMAFKGGEANTIDGWRSEDSGRTWQPTDVSTLDRNQTGSVFGNVVQVPDKGLAVFGHYRPPATEKSGGVWMAFSEDEGRSWGSPRTISETGMRLVEPAFTFTEGRFIGLVRGKLNGGYYVQMTSDDQGETWETDPRGLVSDYDGKVDLPAPYITYDPQNPSRVYSLVSERYRIDPKDLYGRIVLYEADANDLEWKRIGDVARFPVELGDRRDITYAWMTHLGDNRWYVVFYCGEVRGPSDIYGLTMEIPSSGI